MLALVRLPLILSYFILVNLALLVLCVVRPFHRDNVHYGARMYASTARLFGLKIVLRVPDEVKNGGPFVFIGNHQNSYDLITICAATQPGTVTVGKKSLIWVPLVGQMYWLSGNILIDRQNSSKAKGTLDQTVRKIRERRLSVWLFPEGTRSNGRGLLPFKTGAFRIAHDTKEPVAMICASNLQDKVKLNRWNNGTVLVEVLPPVAVDDSRDIRGWAEYFHGRMKEKIAALDKEVAELEKAG
ncbi:1-acylglycerol-3-phosphate O-acyltransferase [Aliiglaciecola sp. CAU 1673]|uniref:1-acylglycerol-3-phosphate O-acyltransferase n=1 Tax=Aliiglaciecola sp. CAU 1673 TaxID=3032595 RepID=UPI0023DA017B|nr:1-acylglycerol-3-phosphate O-acyltransferase [Aliiglaciecola sp. CAU 1673]MDF2178637.1 1-acylglycerol-3-phosphate O-acyltransferase [Aliiglaciecola sp. CAU 1673]